MLVLVVRAFDCSALDPARRVTRATYVLRDASTASTADGTRALQVAISCWSVRVSLTGQKMQFHADMLDQTLPAGGEASRVIR